MFFHVFFPIKRPVTLPIRTFKRARINMLSLDVSQQSRFACEWAGPLAACPATFKRYMRQAIKRFIVKGTLTI
jgi:hypothetical protein